MPFRVVVTDHEFDDLDIERDALADLEVDLVDASARDVPLTDLVAGADALIVMFADIDAAVIDRLEDCRVIARMGIGLDNIDIDAATARGIQVTNVPDYCVDEVSTHTLALMLALTRNVVEFNRSVHRGEWDLSLGRDMHRLSERTLGLVAYGKTAREVARKAAALGMTVRVWDPYVDDIDDGDITAVDGLDELLREVDILSVHPPLTPETEGLIDEDAFELLADDAMVINVARGGIVDEGALAAALDADAIAGAAVDVLTEEPPSSEHPLVGRDDLIVTPHAAWHSQESITELRSKTAANVRAVLEGESPPHPVNDVDIG